VKCRAVDHKVIKILIIGVDPLEPVSIRSAGTIAVPQANLSSNSINSLELHCLSHPGCFRAHEANVQRVRNDLQHHRSGPSQDDTTFRSRMG
jgi:hypothetical protein